MITYFIFECVYTNLIQHAHSVPPPMNWTTLDDICFDWQPNKRLTIFSLASIFKDTNRIQIPIRKEREKKKCEIDHTILKNISHLQGYLVRSKHSKIDMLYNFIHI